MSIRFPYRYKDTPFGRIPDPLITIPVMTPGGWRPFDFIVDSGADVTMVPRSMAEWLGISLSALQKIRSIGIENHAIWAFQGNLKILIHKKIIELPCLFSPYEGTPFLLGRAGLFDRYSIHFDHKKRNIVFE